MFSNPNSLGFMLLASGFWLLASGSKSYVEHDICHVLFRYTLIVKARLLALVIFFNCGGRYIYQTKNFLTLNRPVYIARADCTSTCILFMKPGITLIYRV